MRNLAKFIIICSVFISCHKKESVVRADYRYIAPVYGDIRLNPTEDTLCFILAEHTYKRIESLNLFKNRDSTYMSFYDRGSKSISMYNFYSGRLIKRVPLYTWIRSSKLDKVSVFVKNFDSIYITTMTTLFLVDSTGKVKRGIKYSEDLGRRPYTTTTSPMLFRGNMVYIAVKPAINDKSLDAQRRWRTLYEFDMNNQTKTPYYSLPDIYQNGLLGYAFVDYGYCMNNRGNFVFSFAADPNIYETDLANYHVAYFGRSKFQKGEIETVSKEQLQKEDGYKVYSLRDSYGEILFDPYRKRYLRLAKQKMSEADFQSKSGRKKRSIIVFDETFKIIGESGINDDFSFNFLLFLDDGAIYTMAKSRDGHELRFVRLLYTDDKSAKMTLTQYQRENK
ncbi:protein of unknown function [Chitinophaga filiformis]|uniref:DUF4221 domain-containing protein n=2 Tax=Chitinophaga filiformis TaxID=104663 RepID=A0A1G7UNF4_CHIFI|nr:protein of unknown function [Chitinophaga filiformis]